MSSQKLPTTTSSAEGTGDIIYRNSLDGMPSRDFTIELWTGDITNVPAGRTVELYNDLVSVCYDGGSTKSQFQNHISLWRAENVKMKIRTSFFVSTANQSPASYADGHPVQDDNPAAFTKRRSEDIIQKETDSFIATVDSELKNKESDLLEI